MTEIDEIIVKMAGKKCHCNATHSISSTPTWEIHCSSCLEDAIQAEIRAAESAARAEERKRCADLCRMLAKAHEDNGNSVLSIWAANGCALAIERPTFQEQRDDKDERRI